MLVDHHEADWSEMSPADIERRTSYVIAQKERLGESHAALVLARPSDYGVHRMMRAFSDDYLRGELIEIGLFYDLDESPPLRFPVGLEGNRKNDADSLLRSSPGERVFSGQPQVASSARKRLR
jgi:hypothetical protein